MRRPVSHCPRQSRSRPRQIGIPQTFKVHVVHQLKLSYIRLGYDGQWSTSTLRIGTPPQWVALLPSTTGQETWVIGTNGCDGSEICRSKRGGLFEANISSSWQNVGGYQLGMDTQLGFTGAGTYGFDKIAISDSLSVPDQIVSVVNDTQYWLGYVGLGIKGTNFTQENKPTLLSSLSATQDLIPSYGYTAGASYREQIRLKL